MFPSPLNLSCCAPRNWLFLSPNAHEKRAPSPPCPGPDLLAMAAGFNASGHTEVPRLFPTVVASQAEGPAGNLGSGEIPTVRGAPTPQPLPRLPAPRAAAIRAVATVTDAVSPHLTRYCRPLRGPHPAPQTTWTPDPALVLQVLKAGEVILDPSVLGRPPTGTPQYSRGSGRLPHKPCPVLAFPTNRATSQTCLPRDTWDLPAAPWHFPGPPRPHTPPATQIPCPPGPQRASLVGARPREPLR